MTTRDGAPARAFGRGREEKIDSLDGAVDGTRRDGGERRRDEDAKTDDEMTAGARTTTTLERYTPRDADPDEVFEEMILDWRANPRVKLRRRREWGWDARDAATTAALSAAWTLGPATLAWTAAKAYVNRGSAMERRKKKWGVAMALAASELGWYAHRRGVGKRFDDDENMKATPTRRDFDRFLQLRYDGVLDFNAYIRGWMKTWKSFAFGERENPFRATPSSPPLSRASTPGIDRAESPAFHRETALDFLRFGFHDALSAEEIGERKERELRTFMEEIEAHWNLKFDDNAARESFEFMFHTKEKLGALHQPLLFTAWVNGVAGVTGLALHALGFKLYHGANGCSYWANCEIVENNWKRRRARTETRETRHGRGVETRPVLCGDAGDASDGDTKPIIFVHGLGVGLAPYVPHIAQLLRSRPNRKIAMLTLPHISMRAVPKVPELDDMVDTVVEITKKHAFRAPALYGHSFGTFVVARTCQRFCVSSIVLLDPVCVCLCLPQTVGILYQLNKSWVDFRNRLMEGPRTLATASFWRDGNALLYFLLRDYFLLREIGVMTALRRKFWWARYNLWADDLPVDSLIVLESNDLLLDTDAICRHVLRQSKARIIWQEKFAHGEFCMPWGYGLRSDVVDFLDALKNA